MKAVNVKSGKYIDFDAENNKDSKFKVGDHVRIFLFFFQIVTLKIRQKILWLKKSYLAHV